jgi:uncharacterized delta-60 repeat protein
MNNQLSRWPLLAAVVVSVLSACNNSNPTPSTPEVTNITVTAETITPEAGATVNLNAKVEGTGAFDANIVWKIESGQGSLLNTTSNPNKLTLPSSTQNSQVIVSATSVSHPKITGQVSLSVKGVVAAAVTQVLVTANPSILTSGMSTQLSAVVTGVGAFDPSVTWTLVSGGGTLTPSGATATYSAPNEVNGLTAVIRATSNSDTTKKAEAQITVSPSPTGTVDTSFGLNGLTQATLIGSSGYATAVAAQPNGKLVVVGLTRDAQTHDDFAIVRFNADGTLDTSFDSDGWQTSNIETVNSQPSQDKANAVAIQSDGKIVVAGLSFMPLAPGVNVTSFALCRYNTDGSLDTSFDTDGKLTISFGGVSDVANAVAIQSDNKIVVAGRAYRYGTEGFVENHDYALARLNTDGSFDTSFDTDGKLTTSIGAYDSAEAIAIQTDNKIVVAGGVGIRREYDPNDANSDFTLVRYSSNGSLDSSFGTNGIVRTDVVSGANDFAHAVSLDAQGRILAAGRSSWPWNYSAVRYQANGTPDVSFGTNGRVVCDLGSMDIANAVLSLPNGDTVLIGWGGNHLALVRFSPNGQFTDQAISTNTVLLGDFQGYNRSIGAVMVGSNIFVAGDRDAAPEFALAKFLR